VTGVPILEVPNRYLLLVHWRRLEDHTVGFRGSAEYQRWRDLLHHFYDPFPTVEHYAPLYFNDPNRHLLEIRTYER
jgi:heme-degrading monooxygenase HmoA